MNAERLATLRDLNANFRLDRECVVELLTWIDRLEIDNAALRVDLMAARVAIRNRNDPTAMNDEEVAIAIAQDIACDGT